MNLLLAAILVASDTATLNKQIEAARSAPKPVTIELRDGTYFLDQPLALGAQDNGLTIAAASGAKPVLSGGRRVTGWKKGDGNIWTASVPGDFNFHELWVNGQRRTRARFPNTGLLKITGLPDVTKTSPPRPGQKRVQVKPGEFAAYRNLDDVDVVVFHLWVPVRMAVASFDTKSNIVTCVKASRRKLVDSNTPARFYVENALELLDAPGEWYFDRHTRTLSYLPMPGEEMASVEVIVPALQQVVRLDNTERVTLRGLTFAHAEWWLPRDNTGDVQAAVDVPGAVVATGARHCTIEDCAVVHCSNYGIELGRGCQNNRITRCQLLDLGAGGVRIGETVVRTNKTDLAAANEVTGCQIYNGGITFHQAIGIWIGQSPGNRIANNHIHDLWYSGISIGWTWGYAASAAGGNLVESNHVHHIGMLSNGAAPILSDMGGIYTLGKQPGTVIRHNVFHDIGAVRYGGWGIYFDEGSSGIVAEHNLVYRTKDGGFHQHYGRENVVRNNIFAFGREHQLQRSKKEDHLSFTFEHNIVYWTTGPLFKKGYKDSPGDGIQIDSNLYFNTTGKFAAMTGVSFADWQKTGHDVHSIVADPKFVAPDKDDFTLQPGSPAEAFGKF